MTTKEILTSVSNQCQLWLDSFAKPNKQIIPMSNIIEKGLGFTLPQIPLSLYKNINGALNLARAEKDYIKVKYNNLNFVVTSTNVTEKGFNFRMSQERQNIEISEEVANTLFEDVFNQHDKEDVL